MKQLRYETARLYARPQIPQWYGPLFTVVFCLLFGGAAWLSLTSTLDQMTERDCRLGVQAACEQLNK